MFEKIKSSIKKNSAIINLHTTFNYIRREIPLKEFYKISKIKQFLICRRFSMNNWHSLSILYEVSKIIKKEKIKGDFVECGCCNGGAGAMATAFLKDRNFWLFDSFEGLPKPAEIDIKNDDGMPAKVIWREGWDLGSVENVKKLYFNKLNFKPKSLFIIKGWFSDTVPKNKDKIEKIAVLHLDGDWYESTKVCLENLFDKVEKGGFIVIDDYGHWRGCKAAVDEFLEKRKLSPVINKVDYTRIYFRK